MEYITLPQLKKHLNIEEEYTEEDGYLLSLLCVAEDAIERHIDSPLANYVNIEGKLEPALQHAMLLLAANYYMNRESIAIGKKTYEIPHSLNYLLSAYKNY